MNQSSPLPFLIAGPMLRKATSDELVFWIVTTEPLSGQFHLYQQNTTEAFFSHDLNLCQQVKVGTHAFVTLAHFHGNFPVDECLEYEFITPKGNVIELCPHLLYKEEQKLSIKIPSTANYILHGSCRKPHHNGKDALIAADTKMAKQAWEERPDMLFMAGDQIYADHVAGPMLSAIVQVIDLLGLPNETFSDTNIASTNIASTADLHAHADCFYGRENLLPRYQEKKSGLLSFMPSIPSPIFSSRDCGNHLVSFSEFFAMYLLVWSPQLWEHVAYSCIPEALASKLKTRWEKERTQIEQFIEGLPFAHRLFAHLPTYMIFDDHDVTDDWNLTIGWEKAAYSNAFSKRIIGNGLLSYWLCQGWGNEPTHFNSEFLALANAFFETPNMKNQDVLIQHLYQFEKWHYTIHTSPKVVVLDTRTRRWRSESKMNKPSGLMDWEALIEFQQELMHQDKVVVVSAAPMFGVKFIETLQKAATIIGKPLMIDAENWMAHPGSANTLLSIFTHTKTPTHFVILSGDVHYSFAYDIKLRFRKSSPNIHQVTCSGIKAQFPEPLLGFCDHADRLLYSPRSLLNFFTKRKRLKVKKRNPSTEGVRRLVNTTAIGEVRLDVKGKPKRISILTGEGNEIDFLPTQE
ncbi:alkaline phosphatase family protein [Vibrio sp. S9_S30]|uniref:alkaline phosphatase D family protein n=1 Tax=Vibrio sp. S9_S30 TaxID=2720226 RepID=UPI00168080E4|nr:alkaline phosphatase family protein [Vibrio sp. S9_S30]MBD1556480.1 alkaline phosphatase family protein [Vibrio sp. S9_S30]